MFADDLVISATSEKNLEAQLRKWEKALEGRGLKVNMKKTVVMRSSKGARRKLNIKEESGAKYDQVDEFKYLGSTMASEGRYERAVKDRVKAAWAKWPTLPNLGLKKERREPAAENGNAEVEVGNQSKRVENKRRGVS
ncbi:uncharacterized protein LOC125047571 [Penaeus chinensis]|uniref:uncharacterized protein LOC125047571 n=1 Tax=Penaeus chinensis TaxID=139456 RepID=UPI001FB69496|nr:uncharacterized protein LOC125047571 [Penaeus chinensis]